MATKIDKKNYMDFFSIIIQDFILSFYIVIPTYSDIQLKWKLYFNN